MITLRFEGLSPHVSDRFAPFSRDLLDAHAALIHSLYVVGSAATPDYREGQSDINSLILLKEMRLDFLRSLGQLGSTHRKKNIAAPLVLTPDTLQQSQDVFPMELLELRTIHSAVYGEDLLSALAVEHMYLRIQCEREIKTRLIGLRQGYVSSLGEKDLLSRLLVRSITGCMPLFRGVIVLLGGAPPVPRREALATFKDLAVERCGRSETCPNLDAFDAVLALKEGQAQPSQAELHSLLTGYYAALEAVDRLINELPT